MRNCYHAVPKMNRFVNRMSNRCNKLFRQMLQEAGKRQDSEKADKVALEADPTK